MKGLIVVNGYYKTDATDYQAARMQAELSLCGVETVIYNNNRPIFTGESFDYDFGVFFDKDIHFAEMLEASGVRVFNSAFSIAKADNKLTSTIELQKKGFQVLPTIPAPKQYIYKIDEDFLRQIGEKLGYPLIVKEAYGSLGEQVYIAEDYNALKEIEVKINGLERLYQKYEEKSAGESIRALVVGGELVCGIKFVNKNDFRSNSARGSRAKKIALSAETTRIAVEAARVFQLDFCGVDLFRDGKTVIEINSNAYFKTAESCSGCNVAEAFARHIINTMGEKTDGSIYTGNGHMATRSFS